MQNPLLVEPQIKAGVEELATTISTLERYSQPPHKE